MFEHFFRKVEQVGWRGLPMAVYGSIYARHLVYSRLIARIFPFKKPPILLLSYPRCGSSWIGKVLSFSEDLAYLREPVTQPYQKQYKDNAVIDPYRDTQTFKRYRRLADRAFAGIPPSEDLGIVNDIRDFDLQTRLGKTLLIKEVNPIAANLYVGGYAPKVVFILRHPAAVADSFNRLGWLGGSFEQFGHNYGSILVGALEGIKQGWSLIVQYETVARDPKPAFANLFDTLNLRRPVEFDQVIARFCETEGNGQGPADIQRSSRHEMDKWRVNLTQSQSDDVMRGYLRAGLGYYTETNG